MLNSQRTVKMPNFTDEELLDMLIDWSKLLGQGHYSINKKKSAYNEYQKYFGDIKRLKTIILERIAKKDNDIIMFRDAYFDATKKLFDSQKYNYKLSKEEILTLRSDFHGK